MRLQVYLYCSVSTFTSGYSSLNLPFELSM